MLPIYSTRLVAKLKQAEISGIEYLPINILSQNDERIEGFSIANFTNFIDAFDEGKSIFTRFDDDFPNEKVRGQIAGVMKFVLRREKLIDFDVIRLKEYELRFFVSRKIQGNF